MIYPYAGRYNSERTGRRGNLSDEANEVLMKKRYIYTLLFGIPGFLLAGLISILVFAGLTGMLWLFVFGDDPWPAAAETILATLFILSVFSLWFVFLFLGFFLGKRLEQDPALNRSHLLISAGVTLLLLALIVLQQWNAGSFGPTSGSVLCSDFCSTHGSSASGVTPEDAGMQICSCYDDTGNEILRIPLDHLDPGTVE